jgi:hypothetical protein
MSHFDLSNFESFVSTVNLESLYDNHIYADGKSRFAGTFRHKIFKDLIRDISDDIESGQIKKAFFKVRQCGTTTALILLCFYLLLDSNTNNVVFVSHSSGATRNNFKKLVSLIENNPNKNIKINSRKDRVSNSNTNSYIKFEGQPKAHNVLYYVLSEHNFNYVIMDECLDYSNGYLNNILKNSKNFIFTASSYSSNFTFERMIVDFEMNNPLAKGISRIIKPSEKEVYNYIFEKIVDKCDPLFIQDSSFPYGFLPLQNMYESYGINPDSLSKFIEENYLLLTLDQVIKKYEEWTKKHNK